MWSSPRRQPAPLALCTPRFSSPEIAVLVWCVLLALETLAIAAAGVAAPNTIHAASEVPSRSAAAVFADRNSPPMPAGLRYAEPLAKGEWMLSYRYERLVLDGNREGGDRLSPAEVVGKYPPSSQVPIERDVNIHTLGALWAPFERLTFSLALEIVSMQMKQLDFDNAGVLYKTESQGIGDLKLVGLVPFIRKRNESLSVHFGLNFPTGGVGEKDAVPDGSGGYTKVKLPFPMQLDADTWNAVAGMTYRGHRDGLGWGVQGTGEFGFGSNPQGYRPGHQVEVNSWLSHKIVRRLSGSLRLEYDHWGHLRRKRIVGPSNHAASDSRNSGGDRLELGPGLSVALPGLGTQRLSLEASWPIYQSLNGVQLERDWTLTTGWEWIF